MKMTLHSFPTALARVSVAGIALLWIFVPPPLAAQMSYPGVLAAADETYQAWLSEHNRFEKEFPEAPSQSRDSFCSQDFKARIRLLYNEVKNNEAKNDEAKNSGVDEESGELGLFNKQLQARKLVYRLELEEAQKDVVDKTSLLRTQAEFQRHTSGDIENAKKELDFLQKQKLQLSNEVKKRKVIQTPQALQEVGTELTKGSEGSTVTVVTDAPSTEPPKGSPALTQPGDPKAPTKASDSNSSLLKAMQDLDEAIKAVQTKYDTLNALVPVTGRTMEAISNALRRAQARVGNARNSDSLLDLQRQSWKSYYAMRSAQVDDLCPSVPPPPPPSLPIPRIP